MNIELKVNEVLNLDEVILLYQNAGLKRPILNSARIEKMYANSNLIVSAWVNDELVGVARSITDFSYCCYLSDLAVQKECHRSGIGKMLIDKTREEIGEQCMLLLLSTAEAMEYYPKVGFDKVENGFIIKRKQ
jgi:N-acetylglutamate synthase-like GNAT family acetyltransferase